MESDATASTKRTRKPSGEKSGVLLEGTKIHVLDTNVLMHDPTSLYRFAEHDVFLPLTVLEELDNNKRGMTEVARNARQVTRLLEEIVTSVDDVISNGIPLLDLSHGQASGRLFLQTEVINITLPPMLSTPKNDNQIIAVVMHLMQKYPKRAVILVSKDINMRIKARALNLEAKDYLNDKVLEDSDLLYTGTRVLSANFLETHSEGMESWKHNATTYYRVTGAFADEVEVNEFLSIEGDQEFCMLVSDITGNTVTLKTLTNHMHSKNEVWGITARNREQNFALNALMDPEIDFVTLLGQAGTGKTLLTLAASLHQVMESKHYSEIIMTRVTVPVGEDIGFLPGTEEEKMSPWMGALEDNLDVLLNVDAEEKYGEHSKPFAQMATRDLVRKHIKVKSLNFMRGRTFLNKFLIIDEAQNLTPKQMKTLITRAGPGTKVVCLGNIAQIDTPYLTEGSSGITYVVDRFKGWEHSCHITLQRGERSRLADHASEVL